MFVDVKKMIRIKHDFEGKILENSTKNKMGPTENIYLHSLLKLLLYKGLTIGAKNGNQLLSVGKIFLQSAVTMMYFSVTRK